VKIIASFEVIEVPTTDVTVFCDGAPCYLRFGTTCYLHSQNQWRQQVPQKCQYIFTSARDVTPQKTATCIVMLSVHILFTEFKDNFVGVTVDVD
jgi:hypothetical protein